jgi:hypothetical protein
VVRREAPKDLAPAEALVVRFRAVSPLSLRTGCLSCLKRRAMEVYAASVILVSAEDHWCVTRTG